MTISALRRLAPTLDALLRLMRATTSRDYDGPELDWTRLPTYGGREPRSTNGVWSWDAHNLIVGSCAEDVRVVERPRCREYGCERIADAAGCADGLCAAHYRQRQRRKGGPLSPIRVPAEIRIGVRVNAATAAALGDRPAVAAREVLEAWAAGRRG